VDDAEALYRQAIATP